MSIDLEKQNNRKATPFKTKEERINELLKRCGLSVEVKGEKPMKEDIKEKNNPLFNKVLKDGWVAFKRKEDTYFCRIVILQKKFLFFHYNKYYFQIAKERIDYTANEIKIEDTYGEIIYSNALWGNYDYSYVKGKYISWRQHLLDFDTQQNFHVYKQSLMEYIDFLYRKDKIPAFRQEKVYITENEDVIKIK